MNSRSAGFTLLEVLIAFLVVCVGLLGLAGTLGPIAALAGEGRLRERAALVLQSRVDRLQAELWRGAPACAAPAAGSLQHPDGILESWSAASTAGLVELTITAGSAGKHPRSDSLVTRLPCP